ncbi:MAG: hypothetical protein PHO56_02255 [Patescibacteria group bacterium]|nr:hypothetical protein [Patescibacteria group bacterium]
MSNNIEEMEKELNKPVKCPFGTCDKCEKEMNLEECVINRNNRVNHALFAVVIEFLKGAESESLQ